MQFPRGGGTPGQGVEGTRGDTRSGRRQRSKGRCGQECVLWFFVGRVGEAGWAGLGLARLNNFSGLWSIGAGPGCLVRGPGMIRAGEHYSRNAQ